MASKIDKRLAELGIALPAPASPVGSYVPYVNVGALVFISGQLPRAEGKLAFTGKVGRDVTVENGQAAARVCALNLLAHLKVACAGNLDRVVRCVRMSGFVNSDPEFKDHPQVVNGASDLMHEVFGESGRHARTAVGVAALPANAAVEVEAIFEISVSA
ncbi:MAG TPA: RidA family protein [Burkholderiales bacterium]|jgi:enamine deaminase RidA (YjgF/YER057c/UK114 family)|nr:RidA family protein [Burkholderiales bacterium]